MTRLVTLLCSLLLPVIASAQVAPKGFTWKRFPGMGISVRVPDGWHTRTVNANGTKGLQITKERVGSKGFETGLTINLIERPSEAEFSDAVRQMGDHMAKLHDSFTKIVESRITEQKGVPTWILEGTRTLPNQKERGLYQTRTIVHIMKPSRRIYSIIFGTPADRWAVDYKLGEVMLNPIKFEVE